MGLVCTTTRFRKTPKQLTCKSIGYAARSEEMPQKFLFTYASWPSWASDDLLHGPKRNFRVFDPLDFLAEVTQHIPEMGTL